MQPKEPFSVTAEDSHTVGTVNPFIEREPVTFGYSGASTPTNSEIKETVVLSEALGSTPEETAQLKDAMPELTLPKMDGVDRNMVARLKHFLKKNRVEYFFEPLPGEEKSYVGIGKEVFARRCGMCLDFAEHKQTNNLDLNYVAYYCTACRDKDSEPAKTKEVRPMKYVRYAGHNRRFPSLTPEAYEGMLKVMEAVQEANKGVKATDVD